jgi:L-asparagine transporter-like permease
VAEEEERNRRQKFLDRSFEVQKHISTLSTAASLLILAVYRERPFEGDLLALTLMLLAVTAMIAVHGMAVTALEERRPRPYRSPDPDSFDRRVFRLTSLASSLLIASVVAFALFLFDVPLWLAVGVLVVVIVPLVLIRRKQQRRG